MSTTRRFHALPVVLALLAIAAPPSRTAGQRAPPAPTRARALRDSARVQVGAASFESALALLRRSLEVSVGPTHDDSLESLILLGVAHFFAGRDSATRSAFRSALTLDPSLTAANLAALDPELARLLEAERATRLAADSLASSSAVAPRVAPAVYECVARCPPGVRKPRLVDAPRDPFARGQDAYGVTWGRGRVVIYAVVDAGGLLEQSSMQVVSNTVPGMLPIIRDLLPTMRFQPASHDGRPVRARVALRFEFEPEGTNQWTYRVLVQ